MSYGSAELEAVQTQSVALADQAKAWIREAQRRKANRDQADDDHRPQSRSEVRAIRLGNMRKAAAARGVPFDEQKGLAYLADLEQRGETRAYGPGGTAYR